jgi:two-component system, NtrC family, nitrogen regulation sensor histidine kinase NtrY
MVDASYTPLPDPAESGGRGRPSEQVNHVTPLSFDDQGLPETKPLAFWIGLAVTVLALVSGLATYLILTGLTPIVPRNAVVVWVLAINAVLIIAMIAIVTWQVRDLLRAWKEKVPGARLHIRIVALFSVIAAVPTLLLAGAATTTFARTFDSVSQRTRQIVENSRDVANAYVEEHGQVIRTDIVNMGKDLDEAAATVKGDDKLLQQLLLSQAGLRDLPAAYIINATGQSLLAAIENEKLPYVAPKPAVIALAEQGQIPVMMSNDTFRVAAISRLAKYPGKYLYVVRGVSPTVMGHLRRTQAAFAEYEETRKRRGEYKFAHGLIYFTLSLTALLAAIWVGLWFAGRFVAPIRRLIEAASQVSRGNLNVALPVRRGEGDLRRLSMTFNTMTAELKSQRDALVNANEQLSERRAVMEAVLTGVSAGVLGIDARGVITLANRSAEQLLGMGEGGLIGRPLGEAVPEFGSLVAPGEEHTIRGRPQSQMTLLINGDERTFAVRVTHEDRVPHDELADLVVVVPTDGAVVTFDDITELVSAQRSSAWADIARRIAHEIKNPLTPIQLSAERIKRKYSKVIVEDREIFDKCTDTIIRQVGDVARMVDEFSSFARMPTPQMARGDLREAVRDPVTLFEMGTNGIEVVLSMPEAPIMMSLDRSLLSRAMTNLVKNAAEAIQTVADAPDRPKDYKGRIETNVKVQGQRVVIEVIDNGMGLAKQNRSKLLEPYVTTKAKGTGLGLAIVQKIVEQHGGALTLDDAPLAPGRKRGAMVRITLPIRSDLAALNSVKPTDERMPDNLRLAPSRPAAAE